MSQSGNTHIPAHVVDEVRRASDIVEIVRQDVELKPSGIELKGLCPLHEESTPSFAVNPVKQVFYCHGCSVGGDVINYVQRRDGIEFPQAVQKLAARVGIEVPQNGNGYAPPTLTLESFAEAKDVSVESLKRIGAHKLKENIAFPMFDAKGETTGFRIRRPDGEDRTWPAIKGGAGKLGLLVPEGTNWNEPVWLVEGETDLAAALDKGLNAVGVPGAGKLSKACWERFRGVPQVNVVHDLDTAGRIGQGSIAAELYGMADTIKVIRLPGKYLEKKGSDLRDYFKDNTVEDLKAIEAQTSEWTMDGGKPSQADILVQIVEQEVIEFFRDDRGEPHVVVPIGGCNQVLPTACREFRYSYLAREYRKRTGTVPNPTALSQARIVAEGNCDLAPKRKLHNRVAEHNGAIVYDMSNEKWEGAHITPNDWTIAPVPPIFRRLQHQLEQVRPADGNAVDLLKYLNVDERDHCLLLVSVACFMIPDIPRPAVIFTGTPGTGKSTTSRNIKAVADPSVCPLSSPPKDLEALTQILDHHSLGILDNVSTLPQWMSDALCRAVTGEGFTKRAHYTNDGDHIRSYRRGIIINGVSNAVYAGDMLDRSILIELPDVRSRTSESTLASAFQKNLPGILGGFLRVIAKAMADPVQAEPGEFRMADFVRWGMSIADALDYGRKAFVDAYRAGIKTKWSAAVELSPLGLAIRQLLDCQREFIGTASDLPSLLLDRAINSDKKKQLPKSVCNLGQQLSRMAPALNGAGIEFSKDRSHGGRELTLRFKPEKRDGLDQESVTSPSRSVTEPDS